MKIAGAIFDLDGTLLDTMHMWNNLCPDYLTARGIQPEADILSVIRTMTAIQAVGYIHDKYKLTDSVSKIVDDITKTTYEFYAHKAMLKPGAEEFVRKLQSRGIKMCIATSSEKLLAAASLERCGIAGCFEGVLTCTEVGAGKDKPDIFNKACELLGTPKAHTWVFEDSLYAARTAGQAGFRVCGVYDEYESEQNSLRQLCDAYITSFDTAAEIFV